MEIRIEKDAVNKVLNRREIEFTVTYADRTPSRTEVLSGIAQKLSLPADTTAVVKIEQVYGARMSRVVVHSYATKEAFALEQKHLIERTGKKGGEKKEEEAKPAAPAKEEKK